MGEVFTALADAGARRPQDGLASGYLARVSGEPRSRVTFQIEPLALAQP